MIKARRCRWHKCNAPFEVTDPKYKGKLYCSSACRAAFKQWKIARGTRLAEVAMAWHETRHGATITDHNTGLKMTAGQVAACYGANHPALMDGAFPDLTALTAEVRAMRDEINQGRNENA